MRIDFTDPKKAHLTVPKHELCFVGIWHMEVDLCVLRVENEEYLHFEGKVYKGDGWDPKVRIWHPTQLIMDVNRLARTKMIKYLREYIKDLTEYDLNTEITPVTFPDHLTLPKSSRPFVTAFLESRDIVALRVGTDEIVRIDGEDFLLNTEHRCAADFLDYWAGLETSMLARELAYFVAHRKTTIG